MPFPCPHYPDCPGCPWVARPYDAQLADKHARVVAALRDALGDDAPMVAAVVSSQTTGYRVQTKLMVARTRRGIVLGLYRPGTHDVADATGCPLHDRTIARALPVIRDAISDARVPIHAPGCRGLRYVLVRASVRERRLLVTLVTSADPLPGTAGLARRLRTALPVAGLLLNANATAGNVIVGPRTRRICGDAELRDRYGDVELAASPTAFVQANTRMAERIYRAIAAAARLGGGERVVDLYCGVGGIALTLAPRASSVLGIEEEPASVRAAVANARRNRRRNVRFEVGRVEDRLAALAGAAPDVVTMNPPRKGLAPAVAAALGRVATPRIVYLSCDAESFARDAAMLVRTGYVLERVQPFDMMPHTEHVEVVGELVRAPRVS